MFKIIFAGSLAALVSWFANKIALNKAGSKVIIYLIPFNEEVSKTLLAAFLNAPIILTHLTFGMIEAVFDQINSRNAFWAGLVSILGHALFGYITYIIFNYTGSLIIGIFGGYITHMSWNFFVMNFLVSRIRRQKV